MTYTLVAAYSSVLLNIMNGIVLVPFYFRFFDLATYGSWLAAQNVVTWLGLLELGVNLVFTQRLVQEKDVPERYAATAGSGLVITLASATAIAGSGCILAYLGETWMPGLLGTTADNIGDVQLAFRYAAIGAALTIGQAGFTAIASSWLDMGRVGVISVASLAVGIATTFVGLWSGAGVASLGMAACARGVVGAVGVAIYVAGQWRARCSSPITFRVDVARELLRTIAFPGVARVCSMLASNSEATVAAAFVGPTAAAALGLTNRLYDVARIVLVPITYSVFSPFADVVVRDGIERARALFRELVATVLGLTVLLLVPAIAINASFVRVWLGGTVYVGEHVSLALAGAAFFYTFTNLQNGLMTAMGHIRQSALISLADTVMRVALLLALPRLLGVIGIPLAGVLAGLVTMTLYYVWLARGLQARARELLAGPELAALAVGAAAAALLAHATGPMTAWPSLIAASMVCGLSSIAYVLLVSSAMRRHARDALRRIWR